MKMFLLFLACLCLPLQAAENAVSWTKSGELAYSYAYARTWLGWKMRSKGWMCRFGFTIGAKQKAEHSVWEKNGRKMQIMIWRIDSNKTGYSMGEIPEKEKTKAK